MRQPYIRLLHCCGLVALAVAWAWLEPVSLQAQTHAPPRVVVLELDGIIGPASDDFIVRGIATAEADGAHLVIIRLNTPGGLDTAMRHIIRTILASKVPIATFVAPPGSRAASAGTYIMYASHVAAMAPATNLGSATPVSMSPGGIGGGDESDDPNTGPPNDGEPPAPDAPKTGTAMERKVVNDAVAYIKGLARLRGRNEEWAEDAVRDAVNLTAEDALRENIIDVVADDVSDLLVQIDGRTIELQVGNVVLETRDAVVEIIEPDWRTQLLDVITRPNVAYILMFLGMYGLFFELSNPGAIVPGVLGAISLLLALYAFQVLPVNYAGLALILLGMAFMIAEMFAPSFGVLGIGGVIAFVVGSLILIETEIEAFQVSLPLIIAVTAVTATFVFTLLTLAIRQRTQPVVSGREQMIDGLGQVVADFDGDGNVHIHGEVWAARCAQPLHKNQMVRVVALDGLVLIVEPAEEKADA